MPEENTQPELKSKYNAAIAQLYRLNELWNDAHKSSINHDYKAWNLILDAIWRELAEMENEDSNNEKKLNYINKKIIETGLYALQKPQGFDLPSDDYRIRLGKIYFLLNQKEIFLRRLQKEHGKGSQYEESDDDYAD